MGVEHLQHALRLGEKGVSEGLSLGFCSVRVCVCLRSVILH